MKRFFGGDSAHLAGATFVRAPSRPPRPLVDSSEPGNGAVRIAVYDAPGAAPRTEDVVAATEADLIDGVASRVHTLAREAGGRLPYTVIREVAENLIHAEFREPVVSILESGTTVRFADRGPGIPDKRRALLPGFSTASGRMKSVIRGVGSGLPIVSDYLGFAGGSLEIEDNLGYGAVVTVRSSSGGTPPPPPNRAPRTTEVPLAALPAPLSLTTRQKKVLSLVLELGEVGPTIVSNELSVALSTAYRDLAVLERYGLIESDPVGKRVLTAEGSLYLDTLFAQ